MSERNDGGTAFPCEQHETQDGTWNQTFEPGMSLRDWFAGQALAGLFASRDLQIAILHDSAQIGLGAFEPTMAHAAYKMAEAMLAERRKTKAA